MNKSSDKIVKLRRVQNNSLEIEKLKLEIEKLNKNYLKLNKKIKKLNNSTYVYGDESDGTKLSI